jgi:hypothetical protein
MVWMTQDSITIMSLLCTSACVCFAVMQHCVWPSLIIAQRCFKMSWLLHSRGTPQRNDAMIASNITLFDAFALYVALHAYHNTFCCSWVTMVRLVSTNTS